MSESNERQNPLDFDLRTRIAQAIFKRFECPHGDLADIPDEWESWWVQGSDEDNKQFYDLADAVIRELKLERQDHDPHCDYYRYVTDWIAPND